MNVWVPHLNVKSGNQWRTLATSSDITAAEIRDHRDAGEFGHQSGVADLQGIAVRGAVAQGLAMAADRAYDCRGGLQQFIGCLCV